MAKFIPNPRVEEELARSLGVRAALEHKARQVEEAAKSRVPVATGRLRDSIHVEAQEGEVRVVADAEDDGRAYASYVEFGTSETSAQPFLRPAIDDAAHD